MTAAGGAGLALAKADKVFAAKLLANDFEAPNRIVVE